MSFILEDENLVNLLVYHGLSKHAQQLVGVNPQDFAALRGMIANLEQQATSPTSDVAPGAQVSTEGDQASLNSTHLENLGTLVEFLATNKINIGGKRIAYTVGENVQDPSYPLYKLQGAAGLLELADRNEQVKYGYYINKELLVNYLNSLRGQLVKSPNPVMNAQVEALIHEANDQLDTNMDKFYREPAKTLPPNQVVDMLPQTVKTNVQLYGDGPIPLTFGDISADTNFNSWIQKNKISVDNQPEVDQCAMIKFLLARAASKIRNATSAQTKEIATIYQQQANKLAGEMQCEIGQKSSPGVADRQEQNNQVVSPQSAASLQQLIESLPLQRDDLDFGRIRNFIEQYRNIATSSKDPHRSQQAGVLMDQLEQYMTEATKNTYGQSLTNFRLSGLNANDLVSWANPPEAGQPTRSKGSARALADYLWYIVNNTAALIKDLYNSKYRPLSQNPEMKLAVEQQAGGNSIPFGSSIANMNLNNINVARARLPQVGA